MATRQWSIGRGLTTGTVAGAVLAAALGLLALGLVAPRADVALAQTPSPCKLVAHKGASPAVVPLGYSTRVSMTVKATCPLSDTTPLHIVLVVDSSASMAGQSLDGVKKGLRQFVGDLRLAEHPAVQVGLVALGTKAETLCELTNSAARVTSCISRLRAQGSAGIDKGLDEGLNVLRRGRPAGTDVLREVMILVVATDNGNCNVALRSAAKVKSDGVLLITLGVGPAVDAVCLRQIASSSRFHFDAETASMIGPILDRIVLILPIQAPRLAVVDVLPANMALVPGLVDPPATRRDGQRLIWDYPILPMAGITITFWVTPRELGDHPTNAEAYAILWDDLSDVAQAVFPVPTVKVVDAAGLPTATAIPTLTPAPTPTVVPTRIPVVRPTATPGASSPVVCPRLGDVVPAVAIADALANPAKVAGWGQPCNPSLPPGPMNPPRTTLGLKVPGKPYHPLYNGLQYTCGCR